LFYDRFAENKSKCTNSCVSVVTDGLIRGKEDKILHSILYLHLFKGRIDESQSTTVKMINHIEDGKLATNHYLRIMCTSTSELQTHSVGMRFTARIGEQGKERGFLVVINFLALNSRTTHIWLWDSRTSQHTTLCCCTVRPLWWVCCCMLGESSGGQRKIYSADPTLPEVEVKEYWE
jgi:hypothetical protein